MWSTPHEAVLFLRDIVRGDKCLSSLSYLSTLDNRNENSKKFYSLLLITYGKQRKSSTALWVVRVNISFISNGYCVVNLIAKRLAMKNKEAQWRDEKTAARAMKWFH